MPQNPLISAPETDLDSFSIVDEMDEPASSDASIPQGAEDISFDDILDEPPAPPIGAPTPLSTPPPLPANLFDGSMDLGAPEGSMSLALDPGVVPPVPPAAAPRILLAGRAAAAYQDAVQAGGYGVTVVESGIEALSNLDTLAPDIVVTTLDLGDLSGMELMKAAQAVHPGVRFVLVDDPSFPQQIVAALGEGAVAFVPAGSVPQRLVDTLQDVSMARNAIRRPPTAPPFAPLAVAPAGLPRPTTPPPFTGIPGLPPMAAPSGLPPMAAPAGLPPMAAPSGLPSMFPSVPRTPTFPPLGPPPGSPPAPQANRSSLPAGMPPPPTGLTPPLGTPGPAPSAAAFLASLPRVGPFSPPTLPPNSPLQEAGTPLAPAMGGLRSATEPPLPPDQGPATEDKLAAMEEGLAAMEQELAAVEQRLGAPPPEAPAEPLPLAPALPAQDLTELHQRVFQAEAEAVRWRQLAEANERAAASAAQQLVNLRMEAQAAQAQLGGSSQQMVGLRLELQAAQHQAADAMRQLAGLQQAAGELTWTRERLAQLEDELANLQSNAGAVEGESVALRAALDTAMAGQAAAEARLADAENRAALAEQRAHQALAAARPAANPAEVKEAVDKALGEIKRLIEAVAPFMWGLEQAGAFIENASSGPEKEAHARQLKLLHKVLTRLKDRAEGR